MTPVNQLVSDAGKGDCWRCCIASILGLPAEAVPNFVGEQRLSDGIPADDLCRDWLAERGFAILRIFRPGVDPADYLDWGMVRGAYAIASVPSQRFPGVWHAVVVQFINAGRGGVKLGIVHDPQPLNAPYPEDTPFRRLEFIVPVLPRVPASNLPSDEALMT